MYVSRFALYAFWGARLSHDLPDHMGWYGMATVWILRDWDVVRMNE